MVMESSNVQAVDDSVGEMQILTGARLYHHLCTQNESKQKSVQDKLQSYKTLQQTLRLINTQCRHKILAPVAQGMAYFDAQLYNTNSILVLLGDGWFAQRSASQANQIASRRVDFLQREMLVLREEAKNIKTQKSLLMTQIRATQQAAAPLPTSRKHEEKQQLSSNNNIVNVKDAIDDIDLTQITDATLTTFDIHDELTQDELIELEHELGTRVDDDEYVQQMITQKMIAKKEKRVRAELARRRSCQSQAQANCTQLRNSSSDNSCSTSNDKTKNSVLQQVQLSKMQQQERKIAKVQCVRNSNVTFTTPGDIGLCLQVQKKELVSACVDGGSKVEENNCNSNNEGDDKNSSEHCKAVQRKSSTKRVTFAPDVQITQIPSSKAHPVTQSHYTIGDVIEHSQKSNNAANECATLSKNTIKQTMPQLKPIGVNRSKRKSLFRREMEDMS